MMKCYILAAKNKPANEEDKSLFISYEHRCFPEICIMEFNPGDKIYIPANLFYAFKTADDAVRYLKALKEKSDTVLECECGDAVIETIMIESASGIPEMDFVKGRYFNIIKPLNYPL
jgi:hypothetical protein